MNEPNSRRPQTRRRRARRPPVEPSELGELDSIIAVSLTPQAVRMLERLARLGVYGKDASEVARRFIDECLQEFLDLPEL